MRSGSEEGKVENVNWQAVSVFAGWAALIVAVVALYAIYQVRDA
jgi:hypothetical protein